ncbi:MAG: hypothetical protein V3R28_03495 [Desulfatiglandales bacterium]
MASTTDMNIVLGQGNAIKEVHNVRKQSLEVNQQFVVQKTEDKKKEDRSRIQEFDSSSRIEIKADEEKEKEKERRPGSEDKEKGSRKEHSEEESDLSGGSLVDIKV